jgi:hypothetical protein
MISLCRMEGKSNKLGFRVDHLLTRMRHYIGISCGDEGESV